MLQFWIPRNDEFESALLNAMRIPLLFRKFDTDAEVVTIRILAALGRFENISTLPRETVRAILLNEALHQKIASEPDINKQIELVGELVREALIEENRNVSERLKAATELSGVLERDLAEQKLAMDGLTNTVAAQGEQLEQSRRTTESLRSEMVELRKLQAAKSTRLWFVINYVVLPLTIITALVPLLLSTLAHLSAPRFWFYLIIIWCLGLALMLAVADWRGPKDPAIESWRPYKWLHRWRVFVLGGLLFPMIPRIAWELGKYLYNRK